MNKIDYSKKIPAKVIDADIESFHGLSFITNYIPVRSEATPEELKAAYDTMFSLQKQEVELTAQIKATSDAARQAEVEFHDARFGHERNRARTVRPQQRRSRRHRLQEKV